MNIPGERFDFRASLKSVSSYPLIHKFLPVDRFIVRPPASLIVKAVFKGPITPNQLTVTSLGLAFAAALAYLGGRPGYFALAGSLALLSTIFDAADGMLARAKGITSRYGAFLDLFFDRLADFAVLAGASFGYFLYARNYRFLVFGLLTIGLYFLQLGLYYLNILYTRSEKNGEGAEAKSLAVFLIFVFSVAGRPDGILAGVFLMAFPGVIVKTVRFLRKGRDLEAAPAP